MNWEEIINDKKVQECRFDGYLWYSDKSKPQRIYGKENLDLDILPELPFIIEGNLYDATKRISISIKNVDGEYIVSKHEIKEDELEKKENIQTYIAHDLGDIKTFKMLEIWEEGEPDSDLEEMTSLVPTRSHFIGFK
ncbi:MAG: TIGR04423 family type III CRISPR-associated protein [Saprospiraceae bacterium]